MTRTADKPIVLAAAEEDRFARLRAIAWWDQGLTRAARVLVVGAGALGNEVIKNLALLGVGSVAIVDMDRVEESNLSRSVLFRQRDEGKPKAEAAADAARDLYPELRTLALRGNVLSDVGLGWFRWAQVVVGALDNREARVFVNRVCAQVGRPWIDGGIDVLNGIVRGFAPPATACYECTMGAADWDLLNKRRSCSLLARRAFEQGGTPTTPTTASVIGAIQAQEVIKRVHGLESLAGAGFVFEGLSHRSFTVQYPRDPECPWHEEPSPVEADETASGDTPLRAIAERYSDAVGGACTIDLARELIETLQCPTCGSSRRIFKSAEALFEDEAVCPACGAECVPAFFHSVAAGSPLMDLTPRQLGLPPWDVLWLRRGARVIGVELAGDRASALGAAESEAPSPAGA